MTRSTIAAAALALLANGLAAQEMPAPGPEHEKLHALAGDWNGAETYAASEMMPEGGKGTAHTQMRMVLGGFYLETIHRSDMGGGGVYEGHGMIGWDADESGYVMHWYDNMGGLAESAGTWKDGALVLEGGDESGVARYTYRPTGPGEMDFSIEMVDGEGKAQTFLSTKYKKAMAPPLPECCMKGAEAAAEGAMPECCKTALAARARGEAIPDCCKEHMERLGENMAACCRKALMAKPGEELPECCKKAAAGGEVPPCCQGDDDHDHDHGGHDHK